MTQKVKVQFIPGNTQDFDPDEFEKLIEDMKKFWEPLFQKIPDNTATSEHNAKAKNLKEFFTKQETEVRNLAHQARNGRNNTQGNGYDLPPQHDSEFAIIIKTLIESENYDIALSLLAYFAGATEQTKPGSKLESIKTSLQLISALKHAAYFANPDLDLLAKTQQINAMIDEAQHVLQATKDQAGLKKPSEIWHKQYERNRKTAEGGYKLFNWGVLGLIAFVLLSVAGILGLTWSGTLSSHSPICDPSGNTCEMVINFNLLLITAGLTAAVSLAVWVLKNVNKRSIHAEDLKNYNDEQIAFTESYLTFEMEGDITPELRTAMIASIFSARAQRRTSEDDGPQHPFLSFLKGGE